MIQQIIDELMRILIALHAMNIPTATRHFVWRRTENRSAENEKSFGAELFIVFRDKRKLQDT